VFVPLHIHAPPAESHAFSFQAKALFEGRVTPQSDGAARAQDTVPRKS
jgi:hypothetical protein